jgi:hypothetical protein
VYGAGAASGARAVLMGWVEESTARRLSERRVLKLGVGLGRGVGGFGVLDVGRGAGAAGAADVDLGLLAGGLGVLRGSCVDGDVLVLGGDVDGGLDTGLEGGGDALGSGLLGVEDFALVEFGVGGLDFVDMDASCWCGADASDDALSPNADVGRDDGSEC